MAADSVPEPGTLRPLSILNLAAQANRRIHFQAPPNLNLNVEEKRVYGQLFRQADTESVGVVTGETAVKFFDKTRLDSRVLGEVSFNHQRAVLPAN